MSVDATRATWMLTKEQVTPTEKLFLLSCADRSGETSECWPSIKRICADTGLDRKTVLKVRQSVIDKILVEYTGEMKGRTKSVPVMRLTYVNHREESSPNNGTPSVVSSPNNGTGSSPNNGTPKQSQKRDTEPKRVLNLKEEPKSKDIVDSANTTKTKKPSHYKKDERFMSFYSIYPRKEKPADAWKAFKSLNPDDELLSRIVLDVKIRPLEHTQWYDPKYIPLPASYLRSEAFEGEIFNESKEKERKREALKEDGLKKQAHQESISRIQAQNDINKTKDANSYKKVQHSDKCSAPPEAWEKLKRKMNIGKSL